MLLAIVKERGEQAVMDLIAVLSSVNKSESLNESKSKSTVTASASASASKSSQSIQNLAFAFPAALTDL